ncbi:hypothetical protein Scep_009609 [Stephania cephalantha]|uniref:Uncharacterized protein n=1 Tax=Stephania cephalantha TaxID=152367 RepID=A0AAP0PCN7_9MAGN
MDIREDVSPSRPSPTILYQLISLSTFLYISSLFLTAFPLGSFYSDVLSHLDHLSQAQRPYLSVECDPMMVSSSGLNLLIKTEPTSFEWCWTHRVDTSKEPASQKQPIRNKCQQQSVTPVTKHHGVYPTTHIANEHNGTPKGLLHLVFVNA